jgi:hypothetical protein
MSCEERFDNVLPYTRAAPKMARLTRKVSPDQNLRAGSLQVTVGFSRAMIVLVPTDDEPNHPEAAACAFHILNCQNATTHEMPPF